MQQLRKATVRRASSGQCARHLLATVPVVMRFIRHEMRRHRRGGVTVPQFRALVFVSNHADASLSAMAEHLGLSLPAASRLVQGLVQRGLMVRRTPSSDRRRISLSLTRRGAGTCRAALAATEVALARALGRLEADQLAQVGAAARALNDLFSRNGQDESVAE